MLGLKFAKSQMSAFGSGRSMTTLFMMNGATQVKPQSSGLVSSRLWMMGQPTSLRCFSSNSQLPNEQGEEELPQPEKRLKFSAFARKPKDYSIDYDAELKKKMAYMAEEFQPKPEYTRIEFDENIRHRMDEIDNTMTYRALRQREPQKDIESVYCAVQFEGKTWHLFNAARMPLGRIATLASGFLRGKNKPNYVVKDAGEHGDFVVVVGAANQFMTGRKRHQKIYRRYTGYVGGLKTTSMKHMLERNPEHVLMHAIKGMIPKNKLREDILTKRLFIYPGDFHPHFKQGLPQFTVQEPGDINEEFDFGKLVERRHQYKVVFETDPKNAPEEFADVERDIDQDFDKPYYLDKKTHTNPKTNLKMAKVLQSTYKRLNRFKRSK